LFGFVPMLVWILPSLPKVSKARKKLNALDPATASAAEFSTFSRLSKELSEKGVGWVAREPRERFLSSPAPTFVLGFRSGGSGFLDLVFVRCRGDTSVDF
jgi:hypothetical protein